MRKNLAQLAAAEKRGHTIDANDAAHAILVALRRYESFVRGADAEDVCQRLALEMWRKWDEGAKTLDDVQHMVPEAVRLRKVSAQRALARRPRLSLNDPLENGGERGDIVASRTTPVHERVEQREMLAEVHQEALRLERDLADARPLVRAVERLARQGLTRREIAERLTGAGMAVTPANVRQIVSRLQREYPLLRERWANRAPNGASTRRAAGADPADARKEVLARAGRSGALVGFVADERDRTGSRDWSMIAVAASAALGKGLTSTAVRGAWAAFVQSLTPELRRAVP